MYCGKELHNLIPENQSGFREDRSCSDCIFSLQSTIHLQLRLRKREVYVLFVDFRRAFDSINHNLLWNKLYDIGISAKFIRIIKKLYENATLRVRVGLDLTHDFDITEGVLQGESLSPLLFILFISDFEAFFRSRHLEGLNIDGINEIITLFFADDLVILAFSHIDLIKKIEAFRMYCDMFNLNVNVKKTEIVIFKKAGRRKATPEFRYNNVKINIVQNYTYLGVKFTNSALGLQTSNAAVEKSRIATAKIISTLAILRLNSWESNIRLFDSMVISTLLYGRTYMG